MSDPGGYLQSEVSRLNGEVHDLQGQQDDIDQQIQTLQQVLDDIDSSCILADIGNDHNDISIFDVGANWQGQKREDFEGKKKSAADAAQTYHSNGLDIRIKINNKIGDLNMQKLGLSILISRDQWSISSLQSEIAQPDISAMH